MRGLRLDGRRSRRRHPQVMRAFLDQVELVGLHIRKRVDLAAWPLYLDGLGLGSLSKSEVCAQIALRDVAAASGDLADLRHATGDDADACPHGIAVALRSQQTNVEEVTGVARIA